jgi:xylitol oxidase
MVNNGATKLKSAAGTRLRTWAGNLSYAATCLEVPRSPEELAHLAVDRPSLKALGARHSFNAIADTTGDQISLEHFDSIVIDLAARSATAGAGVTYGQLAEYLEQHGLAVHNLASLPHISVVGACATGTHGSGMRNGSLSTAVRAMELVTGDGQRVMLSREALGEDFAGTVIHLGALGILTSITLAVEPSFQVAQTVYENLSFEVLARNFEEIFLSGYSVSLFTDWQRHRATQVWIKRRVESGGTALSDAEFFGATIAKAKLHPLPGHSAEYCTEQMGIPGPWYQRLPHFKMDFTPSSGAELQSEYFVPFDAGYAAILAVEPLRDQITPLLLISELRTIAADDLWMSPCYRQASLAIHFTWKPDWDAVKQVLPLIEERLAPFQVRPHWGKLFTMSPAQLRSHYPRVQDFLELVARYDPQGKLRNEFLQRNLYSE